MPNGGYEFNKNDWSDIESYFEEKEKVLYDFSGIFGLLIRLNTIMMIRLGISGFYIHLAVKLQSRYDTASAIGKLLSLVVGI